MQLCRAKGVTYVYMYFCCFDSCCCCFCYCCYCELDYSLDKALADVSAHIVGISGAADEQLTERIVEIAVEAGLRYSAICSCGPTLQDVSHFNMRWRNAQVQKCSFACMDLDV